MTRIALGGLILLVGAAACEQHRPHEEATPADRAETRRVLDETAAGVPQFRPGELEMFQQLPSKFESPGNPITDNKVALGRMLYFDRRLSLSGTISCNTCHDLTKHGADPRPGATSLGYRDQAGTRNSPTVLNAAGLATQFWDGRAANVEEQAKGQILNPVEMAMPDAARVVAILQSIPGYVEAFRAAFPDQAEPITYDNVGLAIGAFERLLVTPSRFDRFLAGDRNVLTVAEKRGLRAFLDSGCTACHSGQLLGGESFQKLGAVRPYDNTSDPGRFTVTHNEADRMVFRTSSLRNASGTGPYFHDGKVAELERAIRLMGQLQLGRELTAAQAADIAAFLGATSAEPAPEAIAAPTLPPNGPNTPDPVP